MVLVIFLILLIMLPVLAATAVEHSALGRSTPVGKAVDRISAAAPPLLPLVFWYALGQETYKALPPVRKRAELTARRECVASTAELTKWLQRNSTEDLQVFGIERGIHDHFRAVREGSLDTVDHNALKLAEDAAREADPILIETKDRLPVLRLFSDCRWCTWSNDRLWVDKEIVTTGNRRTHICPDHGGEVREFVAHRDCPDCTFKPADGGNTLRRQPPCWRHGGPRRPVSEGVEQLAMDLWAQFGHKSVVREYRLCRRF